MDNGTASESSAVNSASVEFSVPFHDCDPLHVVWHGNYLRYFELARTKLFQQFKLDVPDIREMGFKMFVSESHCRYLFPLHYNDAVRVTAKFTRASAIIRVSFVVENLTHARKSARAYTELATTSYDGRLFTELPEAIHARIPAL